MDHAHETASHGGALRLLSLCILLLGLAGLAYSPSAAAQSECSATYDSSKNYCAHIVVQPWRWYWRFGNNSTHGPFTTEAATIQNAISFTLGPTGSGQSWCTMTLDHMNYDSTPTTSYGVPREYNHGAVFYVTEYKTDAVPCQQDYMHGFAITQRRMVGCPESIQGGHDWSLINSATYGPYCRIPWNEVFDRQPQLCKGNPCDVLHNTKFQFELDYTGVGPFPLRFQRTYDSRRAFKNYQGGLDEEFFSPLGIGWSATYFQSVWNMPDALRKGAAVIRPDGRRIYYTDVGGVLSAQSGVTEKLIKRVDGLGALTGWQVITEHDEIESYDAEGRLTSIQNRAGLIQTLSYGVTRYPLSVTDPFGRTLTFSYDTSTMGRLKAITLPDGGQITFTFNSSQNVLTAVYPGPVTRQYHYELTNERKNLLTGITDEAGVRFATWTYASYASGGIPIGSKRAGNVENYTFNFTTASTRTVTDPLGQVRVYGSTVRKGQRLMTSSTVVTPSSSEAKSMSYDLSGNVTIRKDFNNNETRFAYDTTRQLETSRTEAYGTAAARTTTTQWHSTFRLPTQIEDPVSRTTLSYDTAGLLMSRTVEDLATSQARTWSYTYNSEGQVLTENGPRTDVSDVTTYTYYACTTGAECGQLHTVTNAAGHTTTFNTYNANGQPLTITDPNGAVTTLTYDLRHRLTSRTIGSETTTIEYWPTGLLKKTTLPDGSFTLNTYDGAHRLIKIEDGEGNRIEYTLDNASNITAENVYDPSSTLVRTRTQVFNALSQLWKQVGSAGTAAVTTTYAYDTNSNQTSVAAPLGRTTGQLYDEFNRLKQITDPGSGVTLFGYDAQDNLASVTDPRGNVTGYSYNGFGDLTQQVSPDTGTTFSTYDSGGNLATKTDARNKTGTFSYDVLNRVTSIAYADRTTNFTYDAGTNGVGRLTGASDADHSLAWSYDTQGRVTGKGQTIGAVTKSIGYGYVNGNLASIVTPSGQTISYGYSNGQVANVTLNGSTTILNNVVYEPFGPVAGWTWGNSTIAVRVYDQDGNPTDIDSAGAYSYAYDDAFRITAINDLADSNQSWSYGYDLNDRLNAASRAAETIGYTYDANGNRLSQTGTQTATYTIASVSNRVTSIVGTPARTYGYDASGNVTGYSALTYAYSDAGRMTSVTNGSLTTSYLINALGQRVKKSSTSATLLFVYDESGHLIGEYDGSGALVQETVWLNDIPVATLRPNGSGGVVLFYVHTDQLSTPRRVSRPSDNAVLWRWDSDPFGNTAPNEDADGDTIPFVYQPRFPGQYFDAESGLIYNYLRDVDPATGRYVQSDPVGLAAGVNTYGHVLQNPIWYVDPFGLDVQLCSRPADLPFPLNLFDHYWVKTGKYEAGMGGPEGNVPAQEGRSDKPYTQTQTVDHSGQSKAPNSQCEVMNNVDEDCVNQLIKPGQPTGRWHPFNQCQNYAHSVVNKCRRGPQIPPRTVQPQMSPVEQAVSSLIPKVPAK